MAEGIFGLRCGNRLLGHVVAQHEFGVGAQHAGRHVSGAHTFVHGLKRVLPGLHLLAVDEQIHD